MKRKILAGLFCLSMVLLTAQAQGYLVNVKKTLDHYWFDGATQVRFGAAPNANISYTGGNLVLDVTSGGGKVSMPDGLDLGTANLDLASSLVFEGATADAFETTLTVVDPTADRTVRLGDGSGEILVSPGNQGNPGSFWGISNGFTFEGGTSDGFETFLLAQDVGADATVTLPDKTGTLIVNNDCTSVISVEVNPTEAGATVDFINLVDNTFSATETDEDMFQVPVNVAARSMYVEVDAAPGVGNDDWKIALRDDGANSALTCAIDESSTSCIAAGFANIAAGSKLNIAVDSSGPDADPATAASLNVSFCLGAQ